MNDFFEDVVLPVSVVSVVCAVLFVVTLCFVAFFQMVADVQTIKKHLEQKPAATATDDATAQRGR